MNGPALIKVAVRFDAEYGRTLMAALSSYQPLTRYPLVGGSLTVITTASWGNLLAEGPNYYLTQPWLMVWPGLAILLTTLAFNLLGDGLRDALDPRAAR